MTKRRRKKNCALDLEFVSGILRLQGATLAFKEIALASDVTQLLPEHRVSAVLSSDAFFLHLRKTNYTQSVEHLLRRFLVKELGEGALLHTAGMHGKKAETSLKLVIDNDAFVMLDRMIKEKRKAYESTHS